MPQIRFTYQPPTAGKHEVGLAGDFTAWEILDLKDIGGVYVLYRHVEDGRYRYKLIVDGVWQPDPSNPTTEPDPFGGLNSLLEVRTDAASRLRWSDVWQNLRLLDDRKGHYLEINRLAENEYELRFNWFPSLPAEITASLDGRETLLFQLGQSANRDVHHCLFTSSEPALSLLIIIKHENKVLFLGAEGFYPSLADAAPLQVDLAGLPVFSVPDWVQNGVIYQIFPDRFCNGDPALDPDFSEDYYADSRTPPAPGEFLPAPKEYFHLVPDWYDISGLSQSPWLPEGKPDWWSFYGGDLPGVRQRLDYLKDLGVSVLYFNPLWPAKSNHKYDAADFQAIDPHFGTLADMQALVREAHAAGMRVIVDVAFNHTGESFWAFRDCVAKGPDSPYWNWYDWQKWPLPKPLPADFQPREYYQCWWGIKDMPDLSFDLSRPHPSENYVRDIAKAVPNQPLVDHLLDSARWWLLEAGIDGFRLDVPDEVPYWFWELFRGFVKGVKPDAWIVGEIWQSARGWVGPRYFDSVMNYAHFKDPVLEFFVHKMIDRQSFQSRIAEGLAQYPIQALRGMMNLLGSHDTLRIQELARGDLSRLKQAILFQMTFPGAPHIYYGDEIALPGGRDPDNRRPFNWRWEESTPARELRKHYQDLIRLRGSQTLLRQGEFAWLEAPDGLLAWQRYDQGGSILCVLNHSTATHSYKLPQPGRVLFQLGDASLQGGELKLLPSAAIVFGTK